MPRLSVFCRYYVDESKVQRSRTQSERECRAGVNVRHCQPTHQAIPAAFDGTHFDYIKGLCRCCRHGFWKRCCWKNSGQRRPRLERGCGGRRRLAHDAMLLKCSTHPSNRPCADRAGAPRARHHTSSLVKVCAVTTLRTCAVEYMEDDRGDPFHS